MHLFLLADWKTFKGIWRFQWSKLSRELPGFQTAASNEPNGNILRTAIPAFSALGGNSQPWKSKCEPFNSQNLAKATFQTCRGNWWNWHGEARFMKGFPRMAYFQSRVHIKIPVLRKWNPCLDGTLLLTAFICKPLSKQMFMPVKAFFRHSLASIFQNVSAHVHLMYYPSKSAAAQQTKIVWAIFQSMVQLHTDISCIFKKLDMKSTIESAGMKRKV